MKTQKLCFSTFTVLSAVRIMRCVNTRRFFCVAYHEMSTQGSAKVALASCESTQSRPTP
ncbi:hypothetical protein PF003_g25676 [Phytophthora fragariae]|nr:hypothetical protein PF003_g25676 [Phytophthora fragariae]